MFGVEQVRSLLIEFGITKWIKLALNTVSALFDREWTFMKFEFLQCDSLASGSGWVFIVVPKNPTKAADMNTLQEYRQSDI